MIRRLIQRVVSPPILLDGSEDGLWSAAATRIPFVYRWMGRSVSPASMNAEFGSFPEWVALREHVLPSDRICPFVINPTSMEMRKGFVVIRDGKPVGGIVTQSS